MHLPPNITRRQPAMRAGRRGALAVLSISCLAVMAFFAPGSQAAQLGQPKFQPITICHATGSASNPYVTITIDTSGQLNGHSKHPGDIIPAPAGGCPKGDVVDLCPHIDGIQGSADQCPPPVDVCPAIEGVQTSTSLCPPPVDVCPAIQGVQTTTASCPPPVPDLCPGITGIQTSAADCPVLSAAQPPVTQPAPVAPATPAPQPAPVAPATATAGASQGPTATLGASAAPKAIAPRGKLPFTGVPLQGLFLLGSSLLLIGLTMHSIGRRKHT